MSDDAFHPSQHDFKVGDRVVWIGSGGYATYSAVPTKTTFKIPNGVPQTVAVGSLFQGLIALTLVTESSRPRAGYWALVHAASGGVGLWLCRLLSHFGVRVIDIVSSEPKRGEAQAAGAEYTLLRSEGTDLAAEIGRISNGHMGSCSVLSGKNITLARPTVFNYITNREEFEGYTGQLFAMIVG